jgi:isoleucyl-tRNA synthetase
LKISKDNTKYLLNVKRDLVGIKYEQLMPLVLPYQNASDFLEILLQLRMEQESFTSPTFGADDAKVAKRQYLKFMLVLDAYGTQFH